MAKEEEKEERAEKKKHAKHVAMEWGTKSLLAIIPAIAASYFSMREAKISADLEAARINARASAGYETLADAVKEMEKRISVLEDEARKLAMHSSKLELRLDTFASAYVSRVEARVSERPPRALGGQAEATILGRGAGASLVEPEKLFRAAKPSVKLPKTLKDAAQMKGAM